MAGGWRAGGWAGVVAAVPVGWLVGWAMRHAVVLLLAVAHMLAFGGTIWPPRSDAKPGAAADGEAR